MRLAIFGAADGTGRLLTEQALERGYEVTTHATDERAYPITHDHLRVVEGDAFDVPSVETIVHNADAVCSAIGVRAQGLPGATAADGTANIVTAMNRYMVDRLVSATVPGLASALPGPIGRIAARLDGDRADFEGQLRVLEESDLEWVLVRPARLTDGPRTDEYRVGTDLDPGFRSTISRADLAAFMLAQVTDDTYLRRTVTVTD